MPRSRARIYSGSPRNLSRLAGVLRSGGIVAVPTETVYGLAGNALEADACHKIFRAKRRPATDPLIVHVLSASDLDRFAFVNPSALLLARKFWPGPLTIVLRKRALIPNIVSAGRDSVALRSPAHPLFRRLLRLSAVPLAAPSANPFGYVSPTTAEHVRAGLGPRIDYILDGGPCDIGLESTIVDLRDANRPRILRPGAVTKVQLARVLGTSVQDYLTADSSSGPQLAPGMLSKHYSPRTRVVLHATLDNSFVARGSKSEAWVFLAKPIGSRGDNIYWLDTRGDLRRVARGLFAMLRKLDGAGYTCLNFECAPADGGLAAAINDRLRRAAAKS